MRISDLFKTATIGVTVNKGRSLLTMLGIIIGVGSVVLMTGVGKSMEGVILGQIDILGPKTLAVFPGKQGPEGGAAAIQADFDALKISDIEAMKELTTVQTPAPVMFVPGDAFFGREKTDPRIIASTPNYYLNQNIEISEGRSHDEDDERTQNSVVVIGPDIVEDLFFSKSPIGKRIEVANRKFTVIGVLKPVGTKFFQNLDDRIIIPFSVAQTMTNRSYLDMATLRSVNGPDIARLDIQLLLRQRHQIALVKNGDEDTENDDFLIRTAEQAQDILGSVSLGLTMFITMVAGISLIVGGIGIMNIMLVAVSERTKEIGLRKAVGAKKKDILFQFLVESVYFTVIGGIIGVVGGLFLAYILALVVNKYLATYVFGISPGAIVVALIVSAAVGLIFGIYPARRASRLSPMEALRYE